jgi:outer membrane protein assembly factor BamE
MLQLRISIRLVFLLGAAALAAGCSMPSIPRIPGITPYKMDIQQGNFLSQEMVSQLKPGMTRDQVRFTLGTPLLADIFHANRWDYVYWFEDARGQRQERKLAVHFQDDKLARVDGDVMPSQAEAAQPKEEAAPAPASTAAPASKEEAK